MRKMVLGILLSSLAGLVMVGLHASDMMYQGIPNLLPSATAQEPKKSDLPPLILDDEPLLLLEEPKKEEKSATEIKALTESQACFVCHVNYQKEPLAAGHAKMGFSCVACHGDSFAHRNDENNTTPPDRMVPADHIETMCKECHITHDAPAIKVIAPDRFPNQRRPLRRGIRQEWLLPRSPLR